jgi:hypothetical protein
LCYARTSAGSRKDPPPVEAGYALATQDLTDVSGGVLQPKSTDTMKRYAGTKKKA